MSFRRGRRIGVDVGSVRIGLALCDPDGILATPLGTVQRVDDAAAVAEISAYVHEHEPLELVVGRPKSLDGQDRASAQTAREFTALLAQRLALPIRLVDERLSTAGAARQLQQAGMNSRKQRGVVDSQAAVLILQQALDAEKTTGRPAGELFGQEGSP